MLNVVLLVFYNVFVEKRIYPDYGIAMRGVKDD